MRKLVCSWDCPYCFETRESETYLDSDTCNKIKSLVLSKIKRYKSLCINWYGGEPLLNIKQLSKLSKFFIDLCNDNYVNYFANITTNGYLFNSETQNLLRHLKVNSAQITIDGNRELHDSRRTLITGEASYDVILKNIANAESEFYIDFRINVDDENIDFITDLIDDLAKINKNNNIGLHVCIVTPTENNKYNFEYERLMTKKIINIYEYALKKSITVSKLNCMLKEYTRFCVIDSDSQYTITPTGSLYKCGESFVDSKDPGYIMSTEQPKKRVAFDFSR